MGRFRKSARRGHFSFVLDVVNAAWPRLVAATSRQQHDAELEHVLEYAASYKIPQRRRQQTYPRAVGGIASPSQQGKPTPRLLTMHLKTKWHWRKRLRLRVSTGLLPRGGWIKQFWSVWH
jgi:hypothetical protein